MHAAWKELDLALHLDAIPKHYQLFKPLDLTSRPYALHTVRVATTLLEVDQSMAKVRAMLTETIDRKAADNARRIQNEAQRCEHKRRCLMQAADDVEGGRERQQRRISFPQGTRRESSD